MTKVRKRFIKSLATITNNLAESLKIGNLAKRKK